MWDFSIGKTISVVLATWPFVLFRMIVYFGITLAYIVATGTGAGIGYGIGHVTGDVDSPAGFAVWGGLAGFGIVAFALYWIREYILYIVKAGHVAVMVHVLEGRAIPGGQGQIAYARELVERRFLEANGLFVLDQLVKGVIGAISAILGGIAALLPIPGLQGLLGFARTVVDFSLSYVDEIVLGYVIREDNDHSWATAQRGLILYAQNGRTIVKNAVWLSIMMWALALLIFFAMLTPAAALLYAMPGQLSGWSFVAAIVFAWALMASVLEPMAIAALLQVYFKAIEGQTPNPEWDARLTEASRHFRELKEKAMASFAPTTRPAPPA